MEASNGLTFLFLFAILGWLGLKIPWFPIYIGETDVATNVWLWQITLDLLSEEEASLGVARSLSVPITFAVVRKMCAQGRAASVTFACRRTVWCWLQFSCETSTLAVTRGVMGQKTAWMVGLMNNFCIGIILVVWVSEIMLVVWVASLGSLFWSLPSTTNFWNHLLHELFRRKRFLTISLHQHVPWSNCFVDLLVWLNSTSSELFNIFFQNACSKLSF